MFEALFWVLILKLFGHETSLSLNMRWDTSWKCCLKATIVMPTAVQTVAQSPVSGTTQGHSDVTSCFCLFVVQIHQVKHILNKSTDLLSFFYEIVLFLWSSMSRIVQNRQKECVIKELR